MIYFLVTQDGERVKIGHSSDPIGRYRSHLTSDPGLRFYAAICGSRDQEGRIHKHFDDYLVAGTREHFFLKDDLLHYVEWIGTQPWAACSADREELKLAYEFEGRFPWTNAHLITGRVEQPALFDEFAPGLRKAKPRSDRNLATLSSVHDDYYTPSVYIDAARHVMGGIDLDPASSPLANCTVGAEHIYTIRDDGLAYEWHGRVWLNPPYGDQGGKFAAHLLREYEAGRVTQAVACLNANSAGSVWFQPLFDFPICFLHHRPDFDCGPEGDTNGGSTHGTVFVYLGPNIERFGTTCNKFGPVVTCAYAATTTREEFRRQYGGVC